MKKGLGCFLVVSITTIGVIMGGYVLSVMWGWFIVPVFDAPPLSVPVAIGVALVIGYLTDHTRTIAKEKNKGIEEAVEELVVWSIIQPLAYLVLGYIIHLFV